MICSLHLHRWWRDLEADSHTTSWSSFTGVLRDAFGIPPDPMEEDLEEDPEEDLEEDLEKDPEERPMQGYKRFRALVEA